MADLIQDINTPITREHTTIMVPDIGDVPADHRPIPIYTETEAEASECTSNDLLPATAAAHATIQSMDTPITPFTIRLTGIVTTHPTLTISPTGATHTTPWTKASLAAVAPTMQHRNLIPVKSSNAQDPQPPINPTTLKLPSSRDSPSDSESDSDPLNF